MIPKYSNIMPQAVVAKSFGAIVAGDKSYLLHQVHYQDSWKKRLTFGRLVGNLSYLLELGESHDVKHYGLMRNSSS